MRKKWRILHDEDLPFYLLNKRACSARAKSLCVRACITSLLEIKIKMLKLALVATHLIRELLSFF